MTESVWRRQQASGSKRSRVSGTVRRLRGVLWVAALALLALPLAAGAATCGNGIVETGEECEGDVSPCLNCRCIAGYRSEGGLCRPVCGDGVKVPGEPCDDGNLYDGDGC